MRTESWVASVAKHERVKTDEADAEELEERHSVPAIIVGIGTTKLSITHKYERVYWGVAEV